MDEKRKKAMKFYQIIAPGILCFMYFTASFGSEKITVFPTDIWNEIDQFRTGERDCYYETGHIRVSNREKEAEDVCRISPSQDFIWYSCSHLDNSEKNEKKYFLSLSDIQDSEGPSGEIEGSIFNFFNNEFGSGLLKRCEKSYLILKNMPYKENKDFEQIGIFLHTTKNPLPLIIII